MTKIYSGESEIIDLVTRFESGKIPRGEWKHREHLVVGLWYLLNSFSFDEALNKMRTSLLNHLKAIGIDFSKEMPYHETLTRFWMEKISGYLSTKNEYSIVELVNAMCDELANKDLPLEYYSRELLFSDRARAEYVAPDLKSQIESSMVGRILV